MLRLASVAALSLQLVNISTGGLQADGSTLHVDISGDGRLVAFDSLAGNLSAAAVGNPDQRSTCATVPAGVLAW